MTLATEAYIAAIEERRGKRREALRGPTSELAAVARHPLAIGTTVRVGGADADIPLAGADRVVAIAATESGFLVDGAATGPQTLALGPRFHVRLSHQNVPALVILDARSPHLADDVELRWFPVDPAMRMRTRLEPDPARSRIGSTNSPDRTAERLGWLPLTIDGRAIRLAALRLLEPGVPDDHLDVYFRDATTGKESYVVGRYLSVEREGDDVVLDFNRAYNPSCALSPYYNCPIPPSENHLSIPIRAGEMAPRTGSTAAHG